MIDAGDMVDSKVLNI